MILTIGTTNLHKVEELRAALSPLFDWTVETLPPGVPDVEETGSTFLANAELKAIHFSPYAEGLTLADDSGLCIDALDGRPGIFSARYAADASSRIARVLSEMKSVPQERRGACFVCALALARKGGVVWTVERRVEGRIRFEPSGAGGFGYDPIFDIPELGCTMAELTMEQKNRISHRGKAIQALVQYLQP